MSIESVIHSNHLILSYPLLLPSTVHSIRVFSNDLALHIRWPKYWSFSFSISPSNDYSWLVSFRMDWFDLLADQGTLKSSPTPQFKSINSLVLSLLYGPTVTSKHDYWKNHSFDCTAKSSNFALSAKSPVHSLFADLTRLPSELAVSG